MSVLQILVLVGVIGGFALLLVALRGSFKSDDSFYGEAPPLPAKSPSPTSRDAGGSGADGAGPVPPDPEGGGSAG